MEYPQLESENALAHIDPTSSIVYITYRNTLNPQATALVYAWMNALATLFDPKLVRGSIFDFRAVTEIDQANLAKARHESRSINSAHDFSHIPTALVVETAAQRQTAELSVRISKAPDRIRIVENTEDALAFFEEWHARQADPSPLEHKPDQTLGL
jgi:hypothetical protein